MKRIYLIFVVVAAYLGIYAQTAREEIAANKYLAASNYLDYNRQLTQEVLTPAPKGYEPFYMSHYGRHGSRWLVGNEEYTRPLEVLRDAYQHGKLTNLGILTLNKLEEFYPCTVDRVGDLTTVGERQHHGIGKRMTENFPEIFKAKNVRIDARSTIVPRCILSMVAECEEFSAANPTARIHNDVSESLQYYLNQPREGVVNENAKRSPNIYREYQLKYTHPERLMRALFNDYQWVCNNIQAGSLMNQLFNLATNMQSHDTEIEFLSLFTEEEIYDQWRIQNIGWYLDFANAPQTSNVMTFSQKNLLKNIISTADTVTQTQATLRFGHEVCVMPLACLLELNNCNVSVDNLDELDKSWQNYKIYPMACNIQLVFYKPKKGKSGDILVKALLNEREARMPVETESFPYYKWEDLRAYYLAKLKKFEESSTKCPSCGKAVYN